MLRSFRCWLTLFAVLLPGLARAQTVSALAADYLAGYQQLHIPDEGFDYQANLRQLPPPAAPGRSPAAAVRLLPECAAPAGGPAAPPA